MSILEDFIIHTNAATTQDEVFQLYQSALASFGFDRVVYSLITDHPSINRLRGHGITGNYPKDWMDYYMKNGYFEVDPVPRYVFTSSEAKTWENIMKEYNLSRHQRMILGEGKDAKLLDGIAVPLHGHGYEVAGIGIASSVGGIKPDKNMLSMIRAISQQFHLAYCSFERVNKKAELAHLTPREKDIISWVAQGKSYSIIGTILSISENTIKFHFKNIMKKLNACNQQAAVAIAISRGLISPYSVSAIEG